jgi:hypothetical protein
MVTKPNMPVPPAPTGLKAMPKIEPMQVATNASQSPKYSADPATTRTDPANKDHNASFKLPEKVSQQSIKDQSFKYGGGRSAGNRSLADNIKRELSEK